MFLDDLEKDGIDIRGMLPEGMSWETFRALINTFFWGWYAIHSNDEIFGFSFLGIKFRKWRWADLHRHFERVFGEEPDREPELIGA